jgi:hypothetical protein
MSNAATCPLCGISRPNHDKLNSLEKEYLETQPMVPAKFHDMLETVDPKKGLAANYVKELSGYFANPALSWVMYLALVLTLAGGLMLSSGVLFPLSFMLFWASLVYLGYDAINFSRAMLNSFLVKRLQLQTGNSPCAVHFKLESQIEKMLESLQMVINSFFDKQQGYNNPDSSSDSFIAAIQTITEQLARNAGLSLDTGAIIWRNNVYTIVAKDTDSQEKAVAIGNKIKEAEAMIFRYRWLCSLQKIVPILKDFREGKRQEGVAGSISYRQFVLEQFFLSAFGPLSEPYQGNFEHVPYELPFKMRFFWHQQLPPFPLNATEIVKELPEVAELVESIQQVRKLKEKLEEQMVLDCVASAVSEIAVLDKDDKAGLKAQEIKRFQLYSQYLDIPKFQPDSRELQEKVDRLRAEMRVAKGANSDL